MAAIIRIATEQDAASIAALYAPYVRETTISFETEAPSTSAMRRRLREVSALFPWLICEDGAGQHSWLRLCLPAPGPRCLPVVGGRRRLCRRAGAASRRRSRPVYGPFPAATPPGVLQRLRQRNLVQRCERWTARGDGLRAGGRVPKRRVQAGGVGMTSPGGDLRSSPPKANQRRRSARAIWYASQRGQRRCGKAPRASVSKAVRFEAAIA